MPAFSQDKMDRKSATWTFDKSQIPGSEIGRGDVLNAQNVAISDEGVQPVLSCLKKEVTVVTGSEVIEGITVSVLSES
ncbi:MAG: hypothetical protein V3W37_10755 [Candidatus Binatia bacterium]|jgi:hypothetical protein